MKRSLLLLSQTLDGWRLFDDGQPVFWFPEKEAGLEVAKTIAETRNFYSGRPTGVELDAIQQPCERVATYG
jgi:hypothetical protein